MLRHLETARLVLRPRLEGEASVFRQLLGRARSRSWPVELRGTGEVVG